MSRRDFSKTIQRVIEGLPEEFREKLHNIAIVIEERPSKARLETMGLDPGHDTLYGLYEGVPLPDRSPLSPPLLPDRITIFRQPLERDFPDPAKLRAQVRLTLLHELAHYFGIDESRIRKLGY